MQAAVLPLPSALKRKGLDAGPATPPAQQQKRPRVSFDPHTRVRPLTESLLNEKPLSLVREDVWRALERHQRASGGADDREYARLRHILQHSNDPVDDSAVSNTLLQKYFVALTSHSHMIGRNCGGLVAAAMDSDWLLRDEHFFVDFQQFITTFLASQSSYVPMVLAWMLNQFSNVPKNPPQIDNLPLVTESQLLDRLHQTLDYIMQVIPTAVGVLENIIDSSFPFDPLNAQSYIEFVTNLLRLTKYTVAIEPKVLRLIIEKLVAIDVELSIALEDKDVDDVEMLVELARAEAENPSKTAEGEEDDLMEDDEEDLDARRTKISQASMIKLDTILNLLFERYTFIMTNEPHRADTAFEQLVATFTRSILPAHNSHHCQYLLFRFCQQNPAMLRNFTATLLQIAFDRSRAVAVRSSAVSYLASLAARGARVESETVVDLFNRLFAELDSLRAGYEVTAKGPDPERYRYYYTVFQACMYLFTFRWRDFLVKAPKTARDDDNDGITGGDARDEIKDEDEDDLSAHRWLPGVREAFSEHIHGRVNPLKVCAPECVNMFEVLCRHTAFLFLAPKIELNRRVRLTRGAPPAGSLARETALSARRGEEGLRLEGHYTFEPYLLPGGRRWVGELYVNFVDVAPPGVVDEAASSDDDDDDE